MQLEQDQEELNNSLISMTSHFAKVQLRLQQVKFFAPNKMVWFCQAFFISTCFLIGFQIVVSNQVVSAPASDREDLLNELQQFAFRGIPNASAIAAKQPEIPNLDQEGPSRHDR